MLVIQLYLVVLRVTCIFSTSFQELLVPETTSNKWDIPWYPWYTTRGRSITILQHAIENIVANTINATDAQRTMGRFNVILKYANHVLAFFSKACFKFLSLAFVFASCPQYHSFQEMHAVTKLVDLFFVAACISGHLSLGQRGTGLQL